MGALIDKLKRLMCDWFHAGGRVKRDPSGCINWQCDTCGRWGDPVSLETEQRVIEGDIRRELAKRGQA
jgi:hypothetical protein